LLKNESSDFLGQTLIDFRTLIGSTDLWYTLGQLTQLLLLLLTMLLMINNGDGDVVVVAMVTGIFVSLVMRRCFML